LSLTPLGEKRNEGSYAKLIQLPPYLFPIKGTLNERTCLPGLAATALTVCAGFVWLVGLNKAVSSNVPGKSDIDRKKIVRAVWHYSTAKRARPWATGAGDSHR
jgi:hypothetical protein